MTTPRQNDQLSAELPDLSPTEWAKFGAGVGLVLAGSGLVSVATLIRLGLVAGGGLLAYRTWAGTAGNAWPNLGTAEKDAAQPTGGNSSYDGLPSLRNVLAPEGEKTAGSLAGAKDVPAVDLRGA